MINTFGFFFFITLHFSRTCLDVSTGLNVSSSFPDFNFSALSVFRSSGCYISILDILTNLLLFFLPSPSSSYPYICYLIKGADLV